MIERQTYSFLEWLGDIGGLYDALRLIGLLFITPFNSFARKAELLSQVFRFTASKRFAEFYAKQRQAKEKDTEFQNDDQISSITKGIKTTQ